MHTYTINGTTHYVSNDCIYRALDETHNLEDIDDHPVHLYSSEEYREYLVRLDWGGPVYSSVEIVALDEDGPPKRHVRAEEFDGATPVVALVPDDVHECPDCGSWAGADDEPQCFECGYGITNEESASE